MPFIIEYADLVAADLVRSTSGIATDRSLAGALDANLILRATDAIAEDARRRATTVILAFTAAAHLTAPARRLIVPRNAIARLRITDVALGTGHVLTEIFAFACIRILVLVRWTG